MYMSLQTYHFIATLEKNYLLVLHCLRILLQFRLRFDDNRISKDVIRLPNLSRLLSNFR